MGDKKERVQLSSITRKGENCSEAFDLHHGQRNPPAGGRQHDRAESVETLVLRQCWCLAHWLRDGHPDSEGVESVWTMSKK